MPHHLVCLLVLPEMSTEMVTPIYWLGRTNTTTAPPTKGQHLPGMARNLALGTRVILLPTRTGWLRANQSVRFFALLLGSAGDVNDDGYDDVLVSSWEHDHPTADEGAVFLWYGSGGRH